MKHLVHALLATVTLSVANVSYGSNDRLVLSDVIIQGIRAVEVRVPDNHNPCSNLDPGSVVTYEQFVRNILSKQENPDAAFVGCWTAAFLAAREGQYDLLVALVNAGASLFRWDEMETPQPLFMALETLSLKQFKGLFAKAQGEGFDVNATDSWGYTLLATLIRSNMAVDSLEKIKWLIQQGADLNRSYPYFWLASYQEALDEKGLSVKTPKSPTILEYAVSLCLKKYGVLDGSCLLISALKQHVSPEALNIAVVNARQFKKAKKDMIKTAQQTLLASGETDLPLSPNPSDDDEQ